MALIVLDVETYPNFFYVGLKRISDGKRLGFEFSGRKFDTDWARLKSILENHTIITFNGMTYDMPVLYAAMKKGATNSYVKEISDIIVRSKIKHWQIQDQLGIKVPRDLDHIDLIEPQPNPKASLKLLNARLHGKKLRELPYDLASHLTPEQMDHVIAYNDNDTDATELLYNNMSEPLEMRIAFGKTINMDLRSKSDTQMGSAIIKARVEKRTGARASKPENWAGRSFKFQPAKYIYFQSPELKRTLSEILDHEFLVDEVGKVVLPEFLSEKTIFFDGMDYQMGIGGLHSTEKNRSIYSDDNYVIVDCDVTGYYSQTILNNKLAPKSLGEVAIEEYGAIREDRNKAKIAGKAAIDKGLKTCLNGYFGLTLNGHSFLYSPPTGIGITLNGQLSIFMLIEAAARVGAKAVSANTDGVTFKIPRSIFDGFELKPNGKVSDRLKPSVFASVVENWEKTTGYNLESVEYRSIHNASVNSYYAIKADGKVKRKGDFGDWFADLRDQMMHNPSAQICSDAVEKYLTHHIPLEQTIYNCTDILRFISVCNVQTGGVWRPEARKMKQVTKTDKKGRLVKKEVFDHWVGGQYLGKVVRYYWGIGGSPIYYKGSGNKVPQTDGAIELMDLPDELPSDIDYARYVAEARKILVSIGVHEATPKTKVPVRGHKQAAKVLLWSLLA